MHKDIQALETSFLPHIAPDSELRIVCQGFRFLEGPVWDSRAGRLLFTDIKGNAIYSWSHTLGLSFYRDSSHLANGTTLDAEGRLLVCEHGTSSLTRIDREGQRTVLAATYRGRTLNSPNDVIVTSRGTILFTDPPSGRSASFGIPRERELDFQGVYALSPRGGEPLLLLDDFEFPNGLCLSPDEKRLYVNDTRRAHIRVFGIDLDIIASILDSPPEASPQEGRSPSPLLGTGKIFASLPEDAPGKADGLKFSTDGLLYCTGPGGILAFDAEGRLAGRIRVPEQTANFAWGDEDMKTLYITASTTLYSMRLGVPGFPAPPGKAASPRMPG